RVGAYVGADRRLHADGAGHRADRAVELRCAEQVEEPPIDRRTLHHAHGAGIGVRKDRLRSVARAADVAEPRRDLSECVVPRYALELARALGADAAHWMQHTAGVVGSLDVPVDLRAEKTAREGVIGVTGNANGAAALDRDEHGAGVRTV